METGSAEGPRFRVRNGRWNLNRIGRRRIAARDHHISAGDYIYAFREAREQNLISKPPLYAVLKYIAPSVLTLITIRYQGKTKGLFEENPVPTWCFLVSTCVYGLIVGIMEQIQILDGKWSQIFKRCAIASGVWAIVALVSIFVPYPLSIVPLIICMALQSVVLSWLILCRAYNLIHKEITSVIDKIGAKLGNLTEDASLAV